MLQLVNRFGGFACEVFHRIGITKPVRALNSVKHVPLPAVRTHVAQRCRDTTLCRNGVRTGRENFGDTRSAQTLFGHAEGRAEASAASADNYHVVFVNFVFV